jgi:hypothetical protein
MFRASEGAAPARPGGLIFGVPEGTELVKKLPPDVIQLVRHIIILPYLCFATSPPVTSLLTTCPPYHQCLTRAAYALPWVADFYFVLHSFGQPHRHTTNPLLPSFHLCRQQQLRRQNGKFLGSFVQPREGTGSIWVCGHARGFVGGCDNDGYFFIN